MHFLHIKIYVIELVIVDFNLLLMETPTFRIFDWDKDSGPVVGGFGYVC